MPNRVPPPPLAEALKRDLERRGIGQSEVARWAGLSQQAVSKWLRQGVPDEHIDTLTEHLGPESEFARALRDQRETMSGETIPGALFPRSPKPSPRLTAAEPAPPELGSGLRLDRVLPAELRDNLRRHATGAANAPELDYLSDRVALEAKRMLEPDAGGLRNVVAGATMQLQFARALLGETSFSAQRRYVVAVVVPPSADAEFHDAVTQLIARCSAIGLVLLVARSDSEIADYVASIENRPPPS